MDFLYDWIKDIAVFMLLVSVIVNLLPKNHYEKYVRLFTGMVMIILLIKPLSTFLNLSDRLDTIFSLDVYKQELSEWEIDFQEMDASFEGQMMDGYKEQLQSQMSLILQEEGYALYDLEFDLCMDKENEDYGQLTYIKVYLEESTVPKIESPFFEEYESVENSRIKEKICEYYQLEKEQVEVYG